MATNAITVSRELSRARIKNLQALLDTEKETLLNAEPQQPVLPGSVIRFEKYDYTWAAIKTVTLTGIYLWYVTQDGARTANQGVPRMTWASLIEWIGERNWDSIEVLS